MQSKKIVSRLSRYKYALNRFKNLGFVKIFSEYLADSIGVTSSQVRKDFSLFGIKGNKRGGYCIDDLLNALNKILGKVEIQKVIIAGAGNIGSALARYKNFEREGIKITACFDIDPTKLAQKSVIPILPFSLMADYIKENGIEIGIIAVPEMSAQEVLNIMIGSGIKGVLNFAPINLKPPQPNCYINNVNLEIELENIIYFVKKQAAGEQDIVFE
jgi:redox-sensing transcriptional repressor